MLSCRKETSSFEHRRVSRVSCPTGGERGGVHSGLGGVFGEIARVARAVVGSVVRLSGHWKGGCKSGGSDKESGGVVDGQNIYFNISF